MKHYSHLNTAQTILTRYQGAQPFHHFIREYFRQHKKYGSKDRKSIARLCYACLRLGKALQTAPLEQQILTGLFLTSHKNDELVAQLIPHWLPFIDKPLEEKLSLPDISLQPSSLFPWQQQLGQQVSADQLAWSMLTQPDLYLRIRPGFAGTVQEQLAAAGFSFTEPLPGCVALDNAAKVDEVLAIDKEVVIQDYSSQRVGELLQLVETKEVKNVWDCCAASGGKSILAYDLLPGISLTVSDIRESILVNLQKRFEAAGIKAYRSFRADMALDKVRPPLNQYDLIIADVPCSGSGTWSRTPEQLYFFDPGQIEAFAGLQQKIVQQAMQYVKPGGYFLYITCSVFAAENEQQVDRISGSGFRVIHQQLLEGYQLRADTLFAALLQKSSEAE